VEKKLDKIQKLDITEEVQEGPSGWMTATEVKDCMVIVHEQHPIQFNLSSPIWFRKHHVTETALTSRKKVRGTVVSACFCRPEVSFCDKCK